MIFGTQNTVQLYKITYEAYCKFANDVNRSTTFKQVFDVCLTHLKYLINFRLLRMCIYHEDKFFYFEFFGNDVWVDFKGGSSLLQHEEELLKSGIPICKNDIPAKLTHNKVDVSSLTNPVLWGWCFNKNDGKVLVSLVCDHERSFATGDVEILKLMVDCIYTKFSEIYLKKQLAIQNKNLLEAYETIKIKNLEIESIIVNQKDIIQKRTNEIVQKNKKLLHILALNAHSIREPLSRIQGIMQLFEFMDDAAFREDLVPRLETSVEEMDEVLREVVETASKELIHLKATFK